MSDALERVAVRLAERISPEDAELAPEIAAAAARGGKEWRAIVHRSGAAMVGGVAPGVEGLGDLAVVFEVIKQCAGILSSVCLMASAGFSIALSRRALREQSVREREIAHLPPEHREALRRVADTVVPAFDSMGVAREKSDEITAHVLHTLGEDAEDGRRFLDAIKSGR